MTTPHYLQMQPIASPDSFHDDSPQSGEVVEVVYPEDQRSFSKRLVEYRVLVQHRDRRSDTGASREYRCTLQNDLAGLAESSYQRLRAATPDPKTGAGKGSKVIVQCLSGENYLGIITGGLRDDRDSDLGRRDSEVVLERQVNGVRVRVMDDGSVSVVLSGPRDLDGETTQDPTRFGSVRMGADGSVLLGLAGEADDAPDQYVRLDAAKDRAVVVAKDGMHVGEATDAPILGTTYRGAERERNQRLASSLGLAQGFAVGASTAATSLAGVVTTPSAAPGLFTTLGAQLTALGEVLGQMQSAIQDFEARSEEFLSKSNRSD